MGLNIGSCVLRAPHESVVHLEPLAKFADMSNKVRWSRGFCDIHLVTNLTAVKIVSS